MNTSTITIFNATLYCPNRSPSDNIFIENLAFWLDGVILTVIAVIGVFTNFLAGYLLNQPKLKNPFNLCLVCLNIIDTIFLGCRIFETLRQR